MKRKRRKRSNRQKLVTALDREHSLLTRAVTRKVYGDLCVFCQKNEIQCCFHFIGRSRFIVRWDSRNTVGACHPCNYAMNKNPHPFIAWYLRNRGEKMYQEVFRLSKKIAKFSIAELEEMLAAFREANRLTFKD